MGSEPDFLGPRQIREALGISSATYYRWLREGKLKGRRVGSRWRFSRRMVDELLGRRDPIRKQLQAARQTCIGRLVALGVKRKKVLAMIQGGELGDGAAIGQLVLEHALRRGASDVHIAPVAEGVGIRERIGGLLTPVDPPLPEGTVEDLVRALKEKAAMDPDREIPQDGHFFQGFDGRKIDVAVSTYPTALGESVTLRLLDPERMTLQLRDAGFSKSIYEDVLEAVRSPRGVFIVNGPTGSGKTTTHYCLLHALKGPGVKIMTAEDPVEFHLDGILQANLKVGMTFPQAMKAMARNDLDIGMVGEMRDAESMHLLFTMAGVGHLMISTMHAPDAVSVIHRFLEIGGVRPRLLVENLQGVLDQRLLPRSCPHCRASRRVGAKDAELLDLPVPLLRCKVVSNKGCRRCNGTGLAGRTVAAELLTLTPELRRVIESGATSPESLREAVPEDHRTLRDDVLEKLVAGEVTPAAAAACLEG